MVGVPGPFYVFHMKIEQDHAQVHLFKMQCHEVSHSYSSTKGSTPILRLHSLEMTKANISIAPSVKHVVVKRY